MDAVSFATALYASVYTMLIENVTEATVYNNVTILFLISNMAFKGNTLRWTNKNV